MKIHVQPPDVIIVGAGPVGLFCALALTRQQIPLRLIDKAPGPGVYSYGLALHAATLDLLSEFGLLDAIMRYALPVHRAGIFTAGRRTAELDFGAMPANNPFLAIVPQSALESILIEALAREGVTVEWNHRLANLHLEPGEVTGTIERREQRMMGYATTHMEWMVDEVKNFHVPYLIGADGHGSLVRQLAQIPFPETGEAENFAVFEFDTLEQTTPEMRLVFDQTRLNIGWPLSRFRYRWGFQVESEAGLIDAREKEREYEQLGDGAVQQANLERLQEFIAQRVADISPTPQRIDWEMIVRFEHGLADYFNEGNVCLVGDSAHATSPAGVQSMNRGCLEAHDLANVLSCILREGRTHEDLETWALEARSSWVNLTSLAKSPELVGTADAALAALAPRLVEALPASGAGMSQLLTQLGFKVPENSGAAIPH